MSLNRRTLGAVLTICTFVVHATAQKNERSGSSDVPLSAIKALGEALSSITTYISAKESASK